MFVIKTNGTIIDCYRIIQKSIFMKHLFFLIPILLLFSCSNSNSNKIILKDSSGRMNHLLVVINNQDWQGKIGNAVREVLAKEVVGLPQPEPMFHLNQISKRGFTSFLNANRNIIFVEYGEKNHFEIKDDIYAEPQKIVIIRGKNKSEIIKLINDNASKITTSLRNGDLKTFRRKRLKKHWKTDKVVIFNELNITMKIPTTYGKAVDSKEYAWFVKDISDGYQNILIYTMPITNEADENGENIIKARDLKGYYIPGAKEGMHMITEKAFTPYRFNTKIDGLNAFETRGKWEMKGDWMAGPFLNYTIVDKKNNRLIVIEGSTYAPNNMHKRDFMFELEAILKTIRIE